MSHHPCLTRRHHDSRPALTLWGEVSFPLARVHEICGPARWTLALWIAARAGGPLIWIAPDRTGEEMTAPGIRGLMDAGQLLRVRPEKSGDMFWTMEESLRSGAAPVVAMELTAPPGITPVRRLHLAAEAGARAGMGMPLGLVLTPDDGGAQAIETRWRLDPFWPGAWRLTRLRARMYPPRSWYVVLEREAGGRPALREVSPGAAIGAAQSVPLAMVG